MNSFQLLAARLITKFGSLYTVVGVGDVYGVEIKDLTDLKASGMVEQGDRVFMFSATLAVGNLINVNGEDLYVTKVEVTRLQNNDIVTRAFVQK